MQELSQTIENIPQTGHQALGIEKVERLRLLCIELLASPFVGPQNDTAEQIIRGTPAASSVAALRAALGTANATLYQMTKSDSYFVEAEHTLRSALDLISKEGNELLWAGIQSAMGGIFGRRYEFTEDISFATMARDSYQAALTILQYEIYPVQWIIIKLDLAHLHLALYTATDEQNWAMMAEEILQNALKVCEKESAPALWASLHSMAGYLYSTVYSKVVGSAADDAKISPHYAEKARQDFYLALQIINPETDRREWSLTQLALCKLDFLELSRAQEGEDSDKYHAIERRLLDVLEATEEDRITLSGIWAMAKQELGGIYHVLFERTDNESYAVAAEECLKEALAVYRDIGPDAGDALITRSVRAETQLANLYLDIKGGGTSSVNGVPQIERVAEEIDRLPFRFKTSVAIKVGDRHANNQAWQEARTAYETALGFVTEEFRNRRTSFLRRTLMDEYSMLYDKHANVLVNIGEYEKAFAVIDAGRARILSEAMSMEGVPSSRIGHRRSAEVRKAVFDRDMTIRSAAFPALGIPSGNDDPWIAARRWHQAVVTDKATEKLTDTMWAPVSSAIAELQGAAMQRKAATTLSEIGKAEKRVKAAELRIQESMQQFVEDSLGDVDDWDDDEDIEAVMSTMPPEFRAATASIQRLRHLALHGSPDPTGQEDAPFEASDLTVIELPHDSASIAFMFESSRGIALIMRDGRVRTVDLPDLSWERLREFLVGSAEVSDSLDTLNEAYVDWQSRPAEERGLRIDFGMEVGFALDELPTTLRTSDAGWYAAQALVELTRLFSHAEAEEAADRAWRAVVTQAVDLFRTALWAPILASGYLSDVHSVLLMPPSIATALPIHAAAPSGLDVAYIPSLNVWRRCMERAAVSVSDSMFLANPTEGSPKLPYSELVNDWIAERFVSPHRTAVHGKEATRETVCFTSSPHGVTHFHGHAYYRADDPLSSAIICADGPLRLEDIRAFMDLSASRLVFLSACSSGLSDPVRSGDEFIGLPGGFLEAGAPAVVASQWPITEASTAFLIDRFYALWLGGDSCTIARALRQSIEWLRQASKTELLLRIAQSNINPSARDAIVRLIESMDPGKADSAAFLPNRDVIGSYIPTGAVLRAAEIIRDLPDDPPFASPVYWAGFASYGATTL